MPWNRNRFPSSMKHLAPAVRAKAMEIGNALLAKGYSEGWAIRIAIAGVERWSGTLRQKRETQLDRMIPSPYVDNPKVRNHAC